MNPYRLLDFVLDNLIGFLLVTLIAIFLWFETGCVELPKPPSSSIGISEAAAPLGPPYKAPGTLEKIFEPTKAAAQEQAIAQGHPIVTSQSPVKKTVDLFVYIMWISAFLAFFGAGACFYFQFYFPGAKLLVASFLLPIAATYLAFHYVAVIAMLLIVAALGVIWGERNTAFEKTVFNDVESEASTLESKTASAISTEVKKL